MTPSSTPQTSTDAANDVAWRMHLAALPECDPPEAVWQRLQAARAQAQARPPSRPVFAWLASAAAVTFAAVLGTQMLSTPATAPSAPLVDATPHIDTPANVAASVVDPASRASLSRIDDAIARAYERNAGDAELDALWQARNGMVETLASNSSAQLLQL